MWYFHFLQWVNLPKIYQFLFLCFSILLIRQQQKYRLSGFHKEMWNYIHFVCFINFAVKKIYSPNFKFLSFFACFFKEINWYKGTVTGTKFILLITCWNWWRSVGVSYWSVIRIQYWLRLEVLFVHVQFFFKYS